MSSTTTNLQLVKPDYEDAQDVSIINANMDKIDTAIKSVEDSVSSINQSSVSISGWYPCMAIRGWGIVVNIPTVKAVDTVTISTASIYTNSGTNSGWYDLINLNHTIIKRGNECLVNWSNYDTTHVTYGKVYMVNLALTVTLK